MTPIGAVEHHDEVSKSEEVLEEMDDFLEGTVDGTFDVVVVVEIEDCESTLDRTFFGDVTFLLLGSLVVVHGGMEESGRLLFVKDMVLEELVVRIHQVDDLALVCCCLSPSFGMAFMLLDFSNDEEEGMC